MSVGSLSSGDCYSMSQKAFSLWYKFVIFKSRCRAALRREQLYRSVVCASFRVFLGSVVSALQRARAVGILRLRRAHLSVFSISNIEFFFI
jgi:hypothetical protein